MDTTHFDSEDKNKNHGKLICLQYKEPYIINKFEDFLGFLILLDDPSFEPEGMSRIRVEVIKGEKEREYRIYIEKNGKPFKIVRLKFKELFENKMIVESERGNEAVIKLTRKGIRILSQTFTEKDFEIFKQRCGGDGDD
jgi:predicted transcriptional regulator